MAIIVSTVHGCLIDHRDLSELKVTKSDSNLETKGGLVKSKCLPEQIAKHSVQSEIISTSEHIHDSKHLFTETVSTNKHNDELALEDSCMKYQGSQSWKLKTDLFAITSPFQMDSQFSSRFKAENQETDIIRKKKRKRKEPLNKGEELATIFHSQVQDCILLAYESIIQAANQKNYFVPKSYPHSDNNTIARKAALAHTSDFFADYCWETRSIDASSDVYCINQSGLDEKSLKEVCNRICRNNCSTSTFLNVDSEKYIIPANCTFIMSDVSAFKEICLGLGKFDLILMDPPWLNKSVKRKKTYYGLENEKLLHLPLELLMNTGCLVAVWVTNRFKHIDFVKKQLFQRKNIEYIASWFWLKVTKTGEMVYDIYSEHKKPYETLIIGMYKGSRDDVVIEENRVFVSVPCSLHSKKPPLLEILREYLPVEPSCLELFARNLTPWWSSWGNEVLLHQLIGFYEEIT